MGQCLELVLAVVSHILATADVIVPEPRPDAKRPRFTSVQLEKYSS